MSKSEDSNYINPSNFILILVTGSGVLSLLVGFVVFTKGFSEIASAGIMIISFIVILPVILLVTSSAFSINRRSDDDD